MTTLHARPDQQVACLLIAALALAGPPGLLSNHPAPPASPAPPATSVTVRLSEWKVDLSAATIPAGVVTFTVHNAGSIPHGIEVEGQGIEKEIELIQPGSTDTLTLNLKPGTYAVYCPVGEDSHKKLGMDTQLKVVAGRGTGMSEMSQPRSEGVKQQAIQVTGGGPVIQILPAHSPSRTAPLRFSRPSATSAKGWNHRSRTAPTRTT